MYIDLGKLILEPSSIDINGTTFDSVVATSELFSKYLKKTNNNLGVVRGGSRFCSQADRREKIYDPGGCPFKKKLV